MEHDWHTDEASGRWTVHVEGDLDLESATPLREHLAHELTRCPTEEFAVDLTAVEFCDSSGLQALTATRRRAQLLDRQFVVVVDLGSRPDRVLHLAGVHDLLHVEHRVGVEPGAAAAE